MEEKSTSIKDLSSIKSNQLSFDPTGNCIYTCEPNASNPSSLLNKALKKIALGELGIFNLDSIEPIASP